MKTATLIILCLSMAPILAPAAGAGDPKAGQALHDKSCTACHGTGVYTRKDRKIKNMAQLGARISGCNANTGAGWFPEEEQHVKAYLNQNFYHFNN